MPINEATLEFKVERGIKELLIINNICDLIFINFKIKMFASPILHSYFQINTQGSV